MDQAFIREGVAGVDVRLAGRTAGVLVGRETGAVISLVVANDFSEAGASVFSAFSQARMLQISGGTANSSSISRWGFMVISWSSGWFESA
jgi:hypothetical protein